MVEKTFIPLILAIILFLIVLIIIFIRLSDIESNKSLKIFWGILILDILFLCFLSYSDSRVDKLIEQGSILTIENVEKITTDIKYIAKNTTYKSIDSEPISVGRDGYIVLFDGENNTIIDNIYKFYNTELMPSDNIKEFSKDEDSENGKETAKIETYYLKNTYRANKNLSKLDKICVELTTKVKIKSYKKFHNTNEYNIIYVSNKDYFKLKSDYINTMK